MINICRLQLIFLILKSHICTDKNIKMHENETIMFKAHNTNITGKNYNKKINTRNIKEKNL